MEREERRPSKVLGHRAIELPQPDSGDDEDDIPLKNVWKLEYRLAWHDAGYAGQDHNAWQDEEYCWKLPGLLETYRAVTRTICGRAPTTRNARKAVARNAL